MRITADTKPKRGNWTVFHVERCEVLRDVLWVDDVLLQWAQAAKPLRVVGNELVTTVHQARAVEVLWDSGLILIDPVELEEPVEETVFEVTRSGA